jgi:O-antigen ligase
MWIAPTYILAGLIFVLWLLGGNVREDLGRISRNGLVWAIVAYFSLHVFGLLWSTEFQNTKAEVGPAAIYLLVPVFMMVLRPEHRKAVLWSFLASMALSCVLSFMIYFQVNPAVFKPVAGSPTQFMSHIHFPIYLTVATAVALYFALFDDETGMGGKIIAVILSFFFAADILISNGRAGQVMFIVMSIIFVFLYFRRRLAWAALISLVVVPLLLTVSYKTVKPFQNRVSAAVDEFRTGRYTSAGVRIMYAMNGLTVFAEHPVAGVGTDDFALELKKAHMRNIPEIPFDVDVHNTYVMKMGQFGVLGLLAVLGLFYVQLRIALRSSVPLQRSLGFAIPLMFAVVIMSDIYLNLHFTSMLFIWISAMVYGDQA